MEQKRKSHKSLLSNKDKECNQDSTPNDPFQKINLLSRFLFLWVYPFVKKAQKKTLEQDDVFKLSDKDSSQQNYAKFKMAYEKLLLDPKAKNRIQSTFYRIYTKEMIIIFLLYTSTLGISLLSIVFVKLLMTAFNSADRGESFIPLIPGLSVMFITQFSNSIIKSNYSFYYSQLTVRMTGALSMAIFEKILKFPTYRNQFYKIGDILNMVQVDILQIVQYSQNLLSLILTFPLLALAAYITYDSIPIFKVVTLEMITAIFFLIISIVIGKIYGDLQKKFMYEKDLRMRSLEEMMRGIKTIKYNCYENYFDERIESKRSNEIKQLYRQNFTQILNSFLNQLSNSVVTALVTIFIGINTFSDFLIIGTTFSFILTYILTVPGYIKGVVVGQISLLRLDNFFSESFVYQIAYHDDPINQSEQAIILKDACFTWNSYLKLQEPKSISRTNTEKPFTINSLNLSVKKGEFVVFYGELGSGKTSILQGILGEMEVSGGESAFQDMVQINGDISISTQDPWLTQTTVKENIIYEQDFDEKRYREALNACCLVEDIAYFVDGDSTTVGEKGDTLSGGQKKRVNLARAIYKQADIYLLDDPLSALDLHVAHHIVRECFNGILKDKTRVLFVNSLLGMEKADRVFVVKDGEIVKEGRFQEIRQFLSKDEEMQEGKKGNEQSEEVEMRQQTRIMSCILENKAPDNDNNFTKFLIQEEEIQSGTIKKHIFMEFFRNIGGMLFLFGILIVFGTSLGSSLYSRLLMLSVQNNTAPTQEEINEQKALILKYCIIDFIRSFSLFLQDNIIIYFMAKLSSSLHKSIVFKLLRASFTKFYNLITTGRIMNRLSKDIYEVDTLLYSDISALLLNIGGFIVVVIMCGFCFSLRVLPIGIFYILFSVFISIYFLKAKRQIVRIEATSKSPILQNLSEILRGITYLRNCIYHDHIRKQFKESVDVDLRNQIALNGVQYWYEGLTNFMSMWPMLISSIIVYFDMTVFSNNAIMIQSSITSISLVAIAMSQLWISFETHFVNYERCSKLNSGIILEEKEIQEKGRIVQKRKDDNESFENSRFQSKSSEEEEQNEDIEQRIVTKPSIELQEASFTYRPDQPNCLRKLNLKIRGAQSIGIVGRTGAGKTSITLALTRVIDLTSGEAILNGKRINQLKLSDLRKEVSVVSQEPYIFEGTLRNNLDPYNEHSEKELLKVFTNSSLSNCSAFLKQQLDSEISQMGENLSEGEKQLVSIARILLKKSTIIIVDEPTSRIDEKTEELVTQMLNTCFKDCLLITIAHRIKTILESDRILVLDHGKIMEFDSPENLLADQGTIFSGIIKAYKQNRIN